MKRTLTIRVERDERRARKHMREGFVRAWNTRRYQGEEFSFESPEALFRAITPARRTVLARLQRTGPSALRALARDLGRDVKAVHCDVQALSALGLVEKDENGKLRVPFARIRTEFELADAAWAAAARRGRRPPRWGPPSGDNQVIVREQVVQQEARLAL